MTTGSRLSKRLDANADVVADPEALAVLADSGVPRDELLEVEALVVLVDDLVAVVTGSDLVVLLAVLGDARLGGRRTRRLSGGGLVGGSGNTNAVVVTGEETRAVLLDSRVPRDKLVLGEGTVLVDDGLAVVTGLGLVVLLAVLGDAVLGGGGAGRSSGGGRAGGRSAGDTNAVVVVGEEAGAVRLDGRVPLDEVVEGEGAVLVDDGLAVVAGLGLVEGRARVDQAGLSGRRLAVTRIGRGGGRAGGGGGGRRVARVTRVLDAVVVADSETVLAASTNRRVPLDEVVDADAPVRGHGRAGITSSGLPGESAASLGHTGTSKGNSQSSKTSHLC